MFGFKKKEKKFYKPSEEIKKLIDSQEGCIATDRITVDGCKVGFMYREDPYQNNNPDSGWRFMAGDENDKYMNDPRNHSVYQVNTSSAPNRFAGRQAPPGIKASRIQLISVATTER